MRERWRRGFSQITLGFLVLYCFRMNKQENDSIVGDDDDDETSASGLCTKGKKSTLTASDRINDRRLLLLVRYNTVCSRLCECKRA